MKNMIRPTLPQVMLGLLTPSDGKVKIQSGLNIPGAAVGCMPQTLSLHSYFSCREILWYYATLGGVTHRDIEARMNLVMGFLKLAKKVVI